VNYLQSWYISTPHRGKDLSGSSAYLRVFISGWGTPLSSSRDNDGRHEALHQQSLLRTTAQLKQKAKMPLIAQNPKDRVILGLMTFGKLRRSTTQHHD